MAGYVQLGSGIVVSEAEFAEMAEIRPELREVATTRDGRDITRGYVDALPLLPPQDTVLQTRGGGNYTLYDEVMRDEQVAACFAQRRLAVVGCEWEVIPGGKRGKDKAAAAALKEQLDGVNAGTDRPDAAAVPLAGWDAATSKMLHGLFYGYAVGECLWGRDGRHVTLAGIKVRRQRRFGFGPDGALKLLTFSNPDGEVMPPRKFWTFTVGADNDDEPYGLGLAHWLYWPVLFKRNGVKFWLIFLEKFGQPTGLGRFPPNATPEEKRRLLAATRAMATDSGIIIPDGMQLELLEAARSGTADYTVLYDRMNDAIAKVILGQTASTQGTPGRLGNDELQGDVRQDIIKADADLVCESFNRTAARWLTDWNYPGAAYPRVFRRIEDDEDLAQVAEREHKVFQMGYRPTLKHVTDTYGGEWEPVRATAPDAGAPPAEFAEAERPAADAVDAQLTLLQQAGDAAVEQWVEQIRALVEKAQSLEALRESLLAAYEDLPADEMREAMALAFALADARGREAVARESGLLDG